MGLDELASARRSPTRQQATRSRRRWRTRAGARGGRPAAGYSYR